MTKTRHPDTIERERSKNIWEMSNLSRHSRRYKELIRKNVILDQEYGRALRERAIQGVLELEL